MNPKHLSVSEYIASSVILYRVTFLTTFKCKNEMTSAFIHQHQYHRFSFSVQSRRKYFLAVENNLSNKEDVDDVGKPGRIRKSTEVQKPLYPVEYRYIRYM